MMKRQKKVDEDAIVAGGAAAASAPAGGDVMSPSDSIAGQMHGNGISAGDVLGHCDHKKDGYMGKNCNHMPKPLKLSTDGTKRKKKRTPYEKGMKILTDAELDRNTILAVHKVPEEVIIDFILRNFDMKAKYVQAMAYYPITKSVFIKFMSSNNKSQYVNVDFNGKRFIPTDDKMIYNATEAKNAFHKILSMSGNNPKNYGSENMELWVIWGDLHYGN